MHAAKLHFLVVGDEDVGRAPATMLLLRRALTASAAVEISSAGLIAPPGLPIAANVVKPLTAMGIKFQGHRSRPLASDSIAEKALILTATRAQASAVLTRDPTALQRTFTLQGLARLMDALPSRSGSAAGWLALAMTSRGRVAPLHKPEDDLPPLKGADKKATAQVLVRIDTACQTIGKSYRS